jgi:CHAD domain-containing protein
MFTPPKSTNVPAPGADRSPPRLNAMMACDTAFRVVARRHLGNLTASHEATCQGNPAALHQMRVALTHLRATISFFSPMVDDARRTQIRGELKWLNAHLGAVRDLDVAIERLRVTANKRSLQANPHDRSWERRRRNSHRHLARALRSGRYRQLVKNTSDWIGHGPWCIAKGKQAAKQRATPIAAYSLRKLTRWQDELLKKSRKLPKLGVKKRHRLRLMNKKLCYSIEALADLSAAKGFSRCQRALKHLRKAHKSLGQLNDGARGQSLAASLEPDSVRVPLQFLSRKREKRLTRRTVKAYRKLAALKPFRG